MSIGKKCSKCRKTKALNEFNVDRTRPDGYRPACKSCTKAQQAIYRANHADKDSLRHAKYRSLNREKRNAAASIWGHNNRGLLRAWHAKRRAKKIGATPPWANEDMMRLFYEQSQFRTAQTGIPHHVDHQYPLNGKIVCGLHCEQNFMVMTAVGNQSKGASMP